MNIGPIESVFLLGGLLSLGVCIWGIVDAASRPDNVWRAAGQSKVLWIVLQAAGWFFCAIGFVLSIVYLVMIRPKLQAIQA